MPFGSTVYGTRTKASDTDIKEVFLPSARDILLQKAPTALVSSTAELDVDRFSLQFFVGLVMQGQTLALEMLFVAPALYLEPPDAVWLQLQAQRARLLSRKSSAFVKYCRAQASKYGVKGTRLAAARGVVELLSKLPPQTKLAEHFGVLSSFVNATQHCSLDAEQLEVCGRKAQLGITVKHAVSLYEKVLQGYGERSKAAADNVGVDWKALMHAVRIAGEADEFLRTGHITLPRVEAPFLLKIRAGELPYEEVTELLDHRLETVEALVAQSPLPETPDEAFAEEFIVRAHADVVRGT